MKTHCLSRTFPSLTEARPRRLASAFSHNLAVLQNMNILLTFTGFHDPYALGLIGQEEQPEPILSLVGARVFDQVILFSTM